MLLERQWGETKPPVGSRVDWGDPITRGLIGHWLFNETAGGRVSDIVANNHGAFVNSPTWVASNKFSTAVKLVSASSQYIVTPNAAIGAGLTAFSLAGWISNTTNITHFPMSNRNSATSAGFGFLYELAQGPEFFLCNAGALTRRKWGANLSLLTFHFVVGTHVAGSNQLTLYVNGVSGGAMSETAATNPADSGVALHFGRDGAATTPNYSNGAIDNIRLWNRAIMSQEVTRLYSEPFAGVLKQRRIVAVSADAAGGMLRRHPGMDGGFIGMNGGLNG